MAEKYLSALESLLFVSGEPLSFMRLSKTLGISEDEARLAVKELSNKYEQDGERGLMLVIDSKEALLATKPVNATFVELLTKSALQETMSKAALEVLSIIAYRAPITRAEVDAIRGVNCSFTLRNLLLRDLISREGNPEDGRGYIYRPTLRFLQVLGVESVEKLPNYETLSQDERLKMILDDDTTDEGRPEKENLTENKGKNID